MGRAEGFADVPVGVALCEIDPAKADCVAKPTSEVRAHISTGESRTFAVVAGSLGGAIPLQIATARVMAAFFDENNVLRGSDRVAITTDPEPLPH